MNIITVVPITRQKVPPTLSYFTASEVPVGAVVSVPLRSKTIHAIVKDTRVAADLKTEIRQAPFEIKKLGKVRAGAFFSHGFIEAARELSDYYATHIGNVLGSVVPESILENAHKISPPLPLQATFLDSKSSSVPSPDETYAVQGDDQDRLSSWRSLIRQQFARKKSVAMYVPTMEDARQLFAALEKGIEGYIVLLHGGLTKKKMLDAWELIATTNHPIVVVATPLFSVLPRGDIESVVIERENGRGWMALRAPYIDYRRVIEAIARNEHRTVFLSDSILRAETLHRIDEGEISMGTPFKWRSISTAVDSMISMKKEASEIPPGSREEKSFQVLSKELEDLITQNQIENTHLFIMTSRRGLASVTVCDDCENIVTCEKCGTPVVLHTSKPNANGTTRNFYLCHACGERMDADSPCKYCQGHRLSPLGIGTERVKEEIKSTFPGIDIFQIDADTTTTEKQITEVMERWRQHPGSILIGTEMALLHMSQPVDHVAVASLDSLFALPDFKIQERIMYILVRLRTIATRSILLQTRKPEEKIFEYGLKGNLSDFYRSVLSDRKRFSYPPFSTLIKITLEGKKDQIAKNMGELQALVNPYEIDVFPAFTATPKGTSLIHGLIKIPQGRWPDTELVQKLSEMPPEVMIKVNPESLL